MPDVVWLLSLKFKYHRQRNRLHLDIYEVAQLGRLITRDPLRTSHVLVHLSISFFLFLCLTHAVSTTTFPRAFAIFQFIFLSLHWPGSPIRCLTVVRLSKQCRPCDQSELSASLSNLSKQKALTRIKKKIHKYQKLFFKLAMLCLCDVFFSFFFTVSHRFI